MTVRRLTPSEVEQWLHSADLPSEEDIPPICTVIEAILVADAAKKGRGKLNWQEFYPSWECLKERIYVAPLDEDCLNRSLFEPCNPQSDPCFWSPAVERGTQPDHRILRLILRPNDNWWGDELYDEMEAQY